MGSRQWAGRHQLWQINPHLHYRGDQSYRGPIGSLRWCCWRERRRGTNHSRGTQEGDKKGLMKGLRGPIGRMMLVVMTDEASIKATRLLRSSLLWVSEVESSRTHFEVLGFGLEAYKSSKIALSSAKNSTIFWIIKISLENARNLAEILRRPIFRDRLKKNFWWPFFWRTLAPVSLVLGLGFGFFCVLGFEPCVLDSIFGDYDFTGRTPESGLSLKFVIYIVCFTLNSNCRTLVVLWLGMKISFCNSGNALRFYWIKKLVAEVALRFWK